MMRSALEHYIGLPQAAWERVGEPGVLAAHFAHAESGARILGAPARRTALGAAGGAGRRA